MLPTKHAHTRRFAFIAPCKKGGYAWIGNAFKESFKITVRPLQARISDFNVTIPLGARLLVALAQNYAGPCV